MSFAPPNRGKGWAALRKVVAVDGVDILKKATGNEALWMMLSEMLMSASFADESETEGVAGAHLHAVRMQAAHEIIRHRGELLYDITDSRPRHRTHLERVDLKYQPHADQALTECTRRLLGQQPGLHLVEVKLDPTDTTQASAWAATYRFIIGRFTTTHDEALMLQATRRKPSTIHPDATAAIVAVIEEIGHEAIGAAISAPHWSVLQRASTSRAGGDAEGAAAAHRQADREAAARKLIGNHENVLRDVANPSFDTNIDGKPLTQLELQRVDAGSAFYADQFLREVARRLLGRRAGLHQLEVRMDPANEAQATAWAETALYLDGRLQAMPEEKPGRTPDLPPLAAAAMRAVLHEVGDVRIVISSTFARMTAQWALLRRAMELPTGRLPGGAWLGATEQQAAALLVHNKESIIAYLTSSTGSPNKPFGEGVDAQAAPRRILDALSSAAISTDIARLGISSIVHCEQVLREVCRQLLGQKFGGAQRNPRDERQATTWATTTMLIHQQILPALVKGLPLHNQDPVANVMAAALYRVGQLVPPTAMKDEASRKLQNAAATRKLRERQPSEIAAEAVHKPQAPRPSPPVPRWPVQASARPPMNPSRALVSSILDPSSVSTGVGFSAPKLRRSSAEAILPVGVSVGADDAFLVSASAPPMHFRSTRPGSHQRSEHSQIDDPRSASHVAPVATPRSVLERVRAHQLGVHERPIDRGYVPTVLPMHLQEEVLSPASSTSKHAVVTR